MKKLFFYHSFKDPAETPWTNNSKVSVLGIPIWNERETVLQNVALEVFSETMNSKNLPFQYDHAVAIIE
jgi:hypothetical protein